MAICGGCQCGCHLFSVDSSYQPLLRGLIILVRQADWPVSNLVRVHFEAGARERGGTSGIEAPCRIHPSRRARHPLSPLVALSWSLARISIFDDGDAGGGSYIWILAERASEKLPSSREYPASPFPRPIPTCGSHLATTRIFRRLAVTLRAASNTDIMMGGKRSGRTARPRGWQYWLMPCRS